MKYRMLPPADGTTEKLITSVQGGAELGGVDYSRAVGVVTDVPLEHVDPLVADGWLFVAMVGTTAERPTGTIASSANPPSTGMQFVDTTLGEVITYDGAAWRNPVTGAAV